MTVTALEGLERDIQMSVSRRLNRQDPTFTFVGSSFPFHRSGPLIFDYLFFRVSTVAFLFVASFLLPSIRTRANVG